MSGMLPMELLAEVATKPPPKPRRTHPKVRTGCATCKARRIKCDETRPGCRNCDRHNVQCPGYAHVISSSAGPSNNSSPVTKSIASPIKRNGGIGGVDDSGLGGSRVDNSTISPTLVSDVGGVSHVPSVSPTLSGASGTVDPAQLMHDKGSSSSDSINPELLTRTTTAMTDMQVDRVHPHNITSTSQEVSFTNFYGHHHRQVDQLQPPLPLNPGAASPPQPQMTDPMLTQARPPSFFGDQFLPLGATDFATLSQQLREFSSSEEASSLSSSAFAPLARVEQSQQPGRSTQVTMHRRPTQPAGFADQVRNLYRDIADLSPPEHGLYQLFLRAREVVPAVTFALESYLWEQELNDFCRACPCLLYAVLSFAASWQVAQHSASAGTHARLTNSCMVYRGRVLQSLQHTYRASDVLEFGAALASILVLAEQAALEGDWQTHLLHLRGFVDSFERNATLRNMSRFASTRSTRGHRLVMHSTLDQAAMLKSPQGRDLSWTLQEIREWVEKQPKEVSVLYCADFTLTADPQHPGDVHEKFRIGGIRHLTQVACDIFRLWEVLVADGDEECLTAVPTVDEDEAMEDAEPAERQQQHQPPPAAPVMGTQQQQQQQQQPAQGSKRRSDEENARILYEAQQLKLELQRWCSMQSPEAYTLMASGESIMLSMLSLKFGLDVLLHRCIVRLRGRDRETACCPTVHLAVRVIPKLYHRLQNRVKADVPDLAQLHRWFSFCRWAVKCGKTYLPNDSQGDKDKADGTAAAPDAPLASVERSDVDMTGSFSGGLGSHVGTVHERPAEHVTGFTTAAPRDVPGQP